MTRFRYRYPGDPVTSGARLTGAEFRALMPDRGITFYTAGREPERIPVEEVVCDGCNAEVRPEDDCALGGGGSRLRTWSIVSIAVAPLNGGLPVRHS